MTDEQELELSDLLFRCGRFLAVILLYSILAVGVFVTSFFVVGWVNETVLQPMVGGNIFLSLALYGATLLFNVFFLARFASSDTVSVPESGIPSSTAAEQWSKTGGGGWGGDEGGGDGGG